MTPGKSRRGEHLHAPGQSALEQERAKAQHLVIFSPCPQKLWVTLWTSARPHLARRENCRLRSVWSKSNQAFLPNKNKWLGALIGMSLRLQARPSRPGSHSAECCE